MKRLVRGGMGYEWGWRVFLVPLDLLCRWILQLCCCHCSWDLRLCGFGSAAATLILTAAAALATAAAALTLATTAAALTLSTLALISVAINTEAQVADPAVILRLELLPPRTDHPAPLPLPCGGDRGCWEDMGGR